MCKGGIPLDTPHSARDSEANLKENNGNSVQVLYWVGHRVSLLLLASKGRCLICCNTTETGLEIFNKVMHFDKRNLKKKNPKPTKNQKTPNILSKILWEWLWWSLRNAERGPKFSATFAVSRTWANTKHKNPKPPRPGKTSGAVLLKHKILSQSKDHRATCILHWSS